MNLYNFELIENPLVEEVYNLKGELLGYFFLFKREGYPSNVYMKFSTDLNRILEYYPLQLGSIEDSIEVFKGNKPYEVEKFSYKKYNILSWDGENLPNQVYRPNQVFSSLKRYTDSKLDMTYTMVYRYEYCDMFKNISWPDGMEEFIRNKNPEYIILYISPEGELKKFLLGYNVIPEDLKNKIINVTSNGGTNG